MREKGGEEKTNAQPTLAGFQGWFSIRSSSSLRESQVAVDIASLIISPISPGKERPPDMHGLQLPKVNLLVALEE